MHSSVQTVAELETKEGHSIPSPEAQRNQSLMEAELPTTEICRKKMGISDWKGTSLGNKRAQVLGKGPDFYHQLSPLTAQASSQKGFQKYLSQPREVSAPPETMTTLLVMRPCTLTGCQDQLEHL